MAAIVDSIHANYEVNGHKLTISLDRTTPVVTLQDLAAACGRDPAAQARAWAELAEPDRDNKYYMYKRLCQHDCKQTQTWVCPLWTAKTLAGEVKMTLPDHQRTQTDLDKTFDDFGHKKEVRNEMLRILNEAETGPTLPPLPDCPVKIGDAARWFSAAFKEQLLPNQLRQMLVDAGWMTAKSRGGSNEYSPALGSEGLFSVRSYCNDFGVIRQTTMLSETGMKTLIEMFASNKKETGKAFKEKEE